MPFSSIPLNRTVTFPHPKTSKMSLTKNPHRKLCKFDINVNSYLSCWIQTKRLQLDRWIGCVYASLVSCHFIIAMMQSCVL